MFGNGDLGLALLRLQNGESCNGRVRKLWRNATTEEFGTAQSEPGLFTNSPG
jgi:hypothetical protein